MAASSSRTRAITSSLVTLGALLLAAETGTGCSIWNPEPPDLQVAHQAVHDLRCDGDIYIEEVVDLFTGSDLELCAYGCGQSQRYLCSDVTGDCNTTWPNVCP